MSLIHSTNIATSGLVLALDAGNIKSYPGSGADWFNIAGSSYNSVLVNSPTYNSANGGYFALNGVNTYAQITTTDGFGEISSTPTMTIDMWANVSRKTGVSLQYQTLAGFRNDSNFDAYFLLLDADGTTNPVNTEARVRTSSGNYDIVYNYVPYFNNWTHIVFSMNTTRSDLYLNGSLVGSNTLVAGSFGANSGNFRIGQSTNAGNYPVKGNIGPVKVYNRGITAIEVSQNFNALRGRYGI